METMAGVLRKKESMLSGFIKEYDKATKVNNQLKNIKTLRVSMLYNFV